MANNGPVLWGTIYDDNGNPINGGLIKLIECDGKVPLQSSVIVQTRSDKNGCYELELPIPYKENYRILFSTSEDTPAVEKRYCNYICYY